LAVFAAINSYIPRDIQPTPPFHGHFLERAHQYELRERYADGTIWEDGEPRDTLLREIEHACIPDFFDRSPSLHERVPSAQQPNGIERVSSSERPRTSEQHQQNGSIERVSSTERSPFASVVQRAPSNEHASFASTHAPAHGPAHEPHTHANGTRVYTPFVFIQGQKGSGRTVTAATVARNITNRVLTGGSLAKSHGGLVGHVVCVSFFRSGGTFWSVLEHIRMEVAMQMRGAKAFEVCICLYLCVCFPCVVSCMFSVQIPYQEKCVCVCESVGVGMGVGVGGCVISFLCVYLHVMSRVLHAYKYTHMRAYIQICTHARIHTNIRT
jgi:hypothetical protein